MIFYYIRPITSLWILNNIVSSTGLGDDNYVVKSISDKQFIWANSPFWDVKSQMLYFVDITGGTVSSYKPHTGRLCTAKVVEGSNSTVSFIIPIKGKTNQFASSLGYNVTSITWDGRGKIREKPKFIAQLATNSSIFIHSAKADPMSRLWAETIGPIGVKDGQPDPDRGAGAMFMLTADRQVFKRISNVDVPDGLAWNAQKTKFYFVDAFSGNVSCYDYDNESGQILNRRAIFILKEHNITGFPTGVTIDTEGMLWVGVFIGGQVLRIDPESGKLLRSIKIPGKQVTSVAFGGKKLDTLFVTTSQILQEISPPTKNDGRVYYVTGLKSSGKPIIGYPPQCVNLT
ncbi:regucalcin-like [Nilaparvata lugens]|uniref:regucalcin-like n=1 Tax=Nilaparvata lugens TaxID=108931 RepID=UPI00193D6A26|nr:regucalcin-like [Nilaparvata lugens]